MCRLIGWVAREPVTLRELLGDDAVARLLHLSTVHCHGWGVAWRAADELLVHRSRDQASSDPGFREVLDSLATTAAVVHLRLATPGFDRLLNDTHPFSDGQWALAHNGAVAPGERVDALLTPETSTPQGTTDSERWFVALRHEYDRLRASDPATRVAAATSAAQVAAATSVVTRRAAAAGLTCSSWNSLLLGPDALFAVNDHDDSWQPADIPVWPTSAGPAAGWPPYLDLRLRAKDGTQVVMSSGIVDDTDGWTMLPNRSVLRLGFADGSTDIADI